MKQRKNYLSLLGCGLLLVLLITLVTVSCGNETSQADTVKKPLSNAAQVFSDAVSCINKENLTFKITQKKETVIGNEVFNERTDLTVTYENIGTEQFIGTTQETLSIGNHTISISELYSGGIGYFTVAGSHFSGDMTADDFIARYAPAVLITPELYSSVTGYESDGSYTVEFASASGLESWLWDKNPQFISSDAAASISSEGQLVANTYNAAYTLDNAFIRFSITVELLPQSEPIQIPEDLTGYRKIAYPDGPRRLEKACGHLLESVSVSSYYTDSIISQAFGDQRTQNIALHAVSTSEWSSLLKTDVSLSNSSKVGSASVITKTELYSGGSYKISVNGSEPSEDADIDADTISAYCQDILVGTIMLPEHILDAELTETEDSWVITLAASEDFAQRIRADSCNTLYQDAEVLSNQAEDYKTDAATCYLTLDKATGLPIASGIRYVGIYTIDALPYRLEFSADQQYELLDDTANSTISAEAGA